jgi:ring-1,2-phenylacetyl-CoA epoxidase subunit PaaE
MIRAQDSAPAAQGAGARSIYVAFAAGADLAALVALVAKRLLDEPSCSLLVFYGNYGDVSDAALEELLALKDQSLGRLALHFIMDREPEEGELLNGRLDAQKLRAVATEFFEPLAVHGYFLAGTGSAVAQLRAQLVQLGVAPQKIHADETAASGAASRDSLAAGAPLPAAGETQVDVIMDGRRRVFTMQTGTESILEAATRAGLDLPFSCRAGVCSTCRTKLVRGEVELAQNYALEDWELAQGFILACQAHAKTAQLEITYDET